MSKVWRERQAGDAWIVDADRRASFDLINHTPLVDLRATAISAGRVLNRIGSMLRAGVMVADDWQPTREGVPQGGVASPVWATLSLTPFDR